MRTTRPTGAESGPSFWPRRSHEPNRARPRVALRPRRSTGRRVSSWRRASTPTLCPKLARGATDSIGPTGTLLNLASCPRARGQGSLGVVGVRGCRGGPRVATDVAIASKFAEDRIHALRASTLSPHVDAGPRRPDTARARGSARRRAHRSRVARRGRRPSIRASTRITARGEHKIAWDARRRRQGPRSRRRSRFRSSSMRRIPRPTSTLTSGGDPAYRCHGEFPRW